MHERNEFDKVRDMRRTLSNLSNDTMIYLEYNSPTLISIVFSRDQ